MVLAGCSHLLRKSFTLVKSSPRALHSAIRVASSNINCPKCDFLKHSSRLTYMAIFSRTLASKQESYFSAIGGESDEPPPDLTPAQITNILRTYETTLHEKDGVVSRIECNQLASNHPVEDRLRVSKIKLLDSSSMLFGVFDGHGGGSCADMISRRLFHYIAVALAENPSQFLEKHAIEELVVDLFACPDPNRNKTPFYDDRAFTKLRNAVHEVEKKLLQKYAEKLAKSPNMTVAEKLRDAFVQCDNDLSDEIEHNLTSQAPNLLLHFYYSTAVSGCCASVLLIHDNKAYVANTGDCKAVLGYEELQDNGKTIKTTDLSKDHNSDNLNELKRIFAAHPAKEQNNVIKNNRLLGQLMPLRAFGDFGYKWPVEKIKRVGLTRAFGPHVIPPFYHTPPYLICEPEVLEFNLERERGAVGDRYIVLATDGLWEQFETARHVVKQVIYHETRDKLAASENISATAAGAPRDANCATHLLRFALGQNPSVIDPHNETSELQRNQEHKRLVTFLTLPESVVRNFRDDISIILLRLC